MAKTKLVALEILIERMPNMSDKMLIRTLETLSQIAFDQGVKMGHKKNECSIFGKTNPIRADEGASRVENIRVHCSSDAARQLKRRVSFSRVVAPLRSGISRGEEVVTFASSAGLCAPSPRHGQ